MNKNLNKKILSDICKGLTNTEIFDKYKIKAIPQEVYLLRKDLENKGKVHYNIINEKAPLSIEKCHIDKNLIDRDLTEYIHQILCRRPLVLRLTATFRSAEDYTVILYYFKFVKKLSYAQMDELRVFNDDNSNAEKANSIYFNSIFGWHYSTNDFEECTMIYLNDIKRLNDIYEQAKKDHKVLEDATFISYYEKMQLTAKPETIWKKYRFLTAKECFKVIYFLYIIKVLSYKEISMVTMIGITSLRHYVKKYGINRTQDEASKAAVLNGRRDYSNIRKTGRATTVRNNASLNLVGSKIENYIRSKIDAEIYKYISASDYEIVIGINTINILHKFEIDIPIVIISKATRKVFKLAIEVDGNVWHDDKETDEVKNSELKNSQWQLFRIKLFSSSGDQKVFGVVDSQINEILEKFSVIIKDSFI